MSFSVYTGGGVAGGYVYANSTVIDSSSGCSHSSYTTRATIRSPGGRTVVGQSSGLQASASLAIAAEFGNYTVTTDGSYYCGCAQVFAGFGGAQTVPVKRPTYLSNYNDAYISGTPPGCTPPVRYWKVRDYQVLDQNQQAINRTMFVDETLTTVSNTCGIGFIEGDGNTTSAGRFRDNFYMCGSVPGCITGNSCTAVRNQSFRVDSSPVTPTYTITYTCSTVTVQ